MEETAKPRILYIEDSAESLMLVRRLLSQDYQVFGAEDGLKGLEVATEIRPDMVLVDLHMPFLTGYEVATRLKSLMPTIPIVALSADVTDNVRERVLASGCDGYLSKPIDPDNFEDQVHAFLTGKREKLQDESFRLAYQETLVARLENNVRELTQALYANAKLNEQNLVLLKNARRRARLLEVGAKVGRNISSILDQNTLLNATVDILCDEFGFYYAGIFLLDETGKWALLHAGRGEAGRTLMAEGYRLKVGGQSMVGEVMQLGKARLALDVGQGIVRFDNPLLPETRSEVALPLLVGGQIIGALSVQSQEEAAFTYEDVIALQTMADQLAVAIDNARLLHNLESAHQELVRTKTYEAIANATGQAIHWVGNKATPIPGSVERTREDLIRYLCLAAMLTAETVAQAQPHSLNPLLTEAMSQLDEHNIDVAQVQAELENLGLSKLQRSLSIESILEDLEIIENSAHAILNIKEDLLGPARQSTAEIVELPKLLQNTIAFMGLPAGVAQTTFAPDLPPMRADGVQLSRVFTNLIKNAMEAMDTVEYPQLCIQARPAKMPGFVSIEITDNGIGIPADQLDQIWIAFFTTKGSRGGTGLGLSACSQIVNQLGGTITVQSEVGKGSTFKVLLPSHPLNQASERIEP